MVTFSNVCTVLGHACSHLPDTVPWQQRKCNTHRDDLPQRELFPSLRHPSSLQAIQFGRTRVPKSLYSTRPCSTMQSLAAQALPISGVDSHFCPPSTAMHRLVIGHRTSRPQTTQMWRAVAEMDVGERGYKCAVSRVGNSTSTRLPGATVRLVNQLAAVTQASSQVGRTCDR
jgi:hypothetical protein